MEDNSFFRLTISRKLLLGFGIMIVLSIALGVAAFVVTDIRQTAQEKVNTANEAMLLAHDIQLNTLEARRREKDYLLRYKEEGFETAKQNYVVTNQVYIEKVRTIVDDLYETNQEEGEEETDVLTMLDDIKQATLDYDAAFSHLVESIEERGYVDTGLEGEFREAAHDIEDMLTEVDDDALLAAMLQVRRSEKDYLLRGTDEEVENTQNAITAFNRAILSSEALATSQKNTLTTLLDTYTTKFDELVAVDAQIVEHEEDFRTAAHSIEPLAEEIITHEDETRASSLEELQQAEDTAQTINMVVLALVIMSGIALAWGISNSITRPLSKIMQATQSIASGNLEQELEIHFQDEIGQLAHSFSEMTVQLRQMIQRETAAREKLHEVLEVTIASYVRFIEGVAQGKLDDRLKVQGDENDPLIRLGHNLNSMADGLAEIILRLEESAESERAAREILQQAVNEYTRFADAVAAGDLTQRLELGKLNGRNEQLLILGENLNRMVVGLADITTQTRDISIRLGSAVAEILAATTQQLASATEQDTSISQTSTTATEVQATVTQTAERAEHVAQTAQRSVKVSERGQDAVRNSVEGMQTIRHQVEGIADNILALSEKTQQIGQIIASVNDIAEQSKVLALNASIEAARAGEEGKSFAVVAMEVRNLAEQSREATEQVREILNEIQQATNAAVMATENGIKGVDTGQELINSAGMTIQELAAVIREAAQAASQIAASTHQQTVGMDQLSAAMEAIRQASIQNTASTQQAERSAQDLDQMAKQMQQTVSRYQL